MRIGIRTYIVPLSIHVCTNCRCLKSVIVKNSPLKVNFNVVSFLLDSLSIRFRVWLCMPKVFQMKVFSTHFWIACSVGSLLQQQKSVRWSCAKSSQNISCLIFGKWQECQETMSLSRYCGLDWHLMFKAITWEVFQCSVFELSDLYPTLLNFIMLNIHLVFESIKECGKKRKLSCFLGI